LNEVPAPLAVPLKIFTGNSPGENLVYVTKNSS